MTGRVTKQSFTTTRLAALCCLFLTLLTACRASGHNADKVTLTLAAYTTPREAYSKAIIPAFQRYWRAQTGREVEVQESYQASGAQSRAVISGFEADVVALSLEGDVERIAQSGLITHDWQAKRHKGIVSTSVVVIAVRPSNPQGIRDWNDLARPGLNVLTPDPKTSGGAQWNIVAAYGAALRGRASTAQGDPAAAREFLKRLLNNVSIMDKGARESILNFEKGVGDAAITYENEVLVARQAGRQYEYVVPASTVLIENPVAVVDKYVDKHGVRAAAEAFVAFLWTQEAQRVYAQYGLRPVAPELVADLAGQFPPVADLWKIDFLGGWRRVDTELFGAAGAYTQTIGELHAR